jgi:putative ABC transport system permease protein
MLGIIGGRVMKMAPAIRGLLEPDLSAGLMIVAIGIAIFVGVLSGLYPAWRSSRLAPSLAVRDE